MSEFTSSSPDALFDAAAFQARQHALLTDPWRHQLIGQPDFSGRIVSRSTADTMFGNWSESASLAERVDRIQRMAPYVRGLTDGPGGWIDSVLRQIRALTVSIGQVDTVRFPGQATRRAELAAQHAELVKDTERRLEQTIRLSLAPDLKPFRNQAAGLDFRVGGPVAPPVTRREVEKAEAWTVEAFVTRLRANGVFAERDDENLGFSWSNGIALSPADRATLASKFDEIGLFLATRPDLVGPPPPPPPPPPPVYVSPTKPEVPPAAQASVAVEATAEAPTVPEAPRAALEPEAPEDVEVPPIPPAAPEAETVATPSTAPVEPKKRRAHAYATHRLPSR